jgi:hypothetical protein
MIALCTHMDSTTLAWLAEYEMAIDSLTGPYAAFLLFYNEAVFEVDTSGRYPPVLWRPTVVRPSDTALQVPLPAQAIRRGSRGVDDILRFNPLARPDAEVLATSMTYESDAVARLLGVTAELPCILITDRAAPSEFLVLSIDSDLSKLAKELRELLANLIDDPRRGRYLRTLEDWHATQRSIEHLRKAIASVEYKTSVTPNLIDPGRASLLVDELCRLTRDDKPAEALRIFRTMSEQVPSAISSDLKAIGRTNSALQKFRGRRSSINLDELSDVIATLPDPYCATNPRSVSEAVTVLEAYKHAATARTSQAFKEWLLVACRLNNITFG